MTNLTIGENTRIKLGWVAGIIGTIVGVVGTGAWLFATDRTTVLSKINSHSTDITKLQEQAIKELAAISDMQSQIKSILDERFTISMAAEQALRHAMENPGTRVPDPRDPRQILKVESK